MLILSQVLFVHFSSLTRFILRLVYISTNKIVASGTPKVYKDCQKTISFTKSHCVVPHLDWSWWTRVWHKLSILVATTAELSIFLTWKLRYVCCIINMRFQQDTVTSHTTRRFLTLMHEKFSLPIISCMWFGH